MLFSLNEFLQNKIQPLKHVHLVRESVAHKKQMNYKTSHRRHHLRIMMGLFKKFEIYSSTHIFHSSYQHSQIFHFFLCCWQRGLFRKNCQKTQFEHCDCCGVFLTYSKVIHLSPSPVCSRSSVILNRTYHKVNFF